MSRFSSVPDFYERVVYPAAGPNLVVEQKSTIIRVLLLIRALEYGFI
jgi:hypothetical protein